MKKNSKMGKFKLLLRCFFYVYGFILLPLSIIIYDRFYLLHGRSLCRHQFKGIICESCKYLTFLINFLLTFWLLFSLVPDRYCSGYVIYFSLAFMGCWDWLVVARFFDWLFKDDEKC